MVELIKVSAKSRSSAVAGAIAGVMREHHDAQVQAIGAGAVNQAIKAIAIARGYLQNDGLDIWCVPVFVDVDVSGEERTAIRFNVEVRGTFTPPVPPEMPPPAEEPAPPA
ncbi:MAG: stage V sporulation protein S [Chloroflexi bacterium]|nr:stage V sporulation protein S [Chloroflexota bacterium]